MTPTRTSLPTREFVEKAKRAIDVEGIDLSTIAPLVVTFSEVETVYTSDKTFKEVYDAFANGNRVLAKVGNLFTIVTNAGLATTTYTIGFDVKNLGFTSETISTGTADQKITIS